MEKILVEKEIFLKEINKKGVLKIYFDAQLAINKGWESLYFADNLADFANIIVDGYIITLGTYGDIQLLSANCDERFDNGDVEEIRKIIDTDKLDDYIMNNNNWFAVVIGKIIKEENGIIQYESIEDEVFEPCPKTIEELEDDLIMFTESLIKDCVPELIK